MGEIGSGGGSGYPAALDTNSSLEVDSPAAGKTKARADVPNDLAAACVAIETEMGTDPAGSMTDVKTRLAVSLNDDGTLKSGVALTGDFLRSNFAFASTTTITIDSGYYELGDLIREISSTLTFTPGSGGSNGDSTDLGNSETHFVYLDSSAISTDVTLTASDFLNVETAPTYSQSKRGWYGSATGNLTTSDRCIFSFTTDGSANIHDFNHSGELVVLMDEIADQAAVDIDTTFTDIAALSIPAFATKARVRFSPGVATAFWRWRTNGSTGTTAAQIGSVHIADGCVEDVITDSSQIFEMKTDVSNTATIEVSTQGWYFPEGM